MNAITISIYDGLAHSNNLSIVQMRISVDSSILVEVNHVFNSINRASSIETNNTAFLRSTLIISEKCSLIQMRGMPD